MEEEQGEELEDDCNKRRQLTILFINKCFILHADNVRCEVLEEGIRSVSPAVFTSMTSKL